MSPEPTTASSRPATTARWRARPRRLRARLVPRPRGDRAREDRGHREGDEARARLGRRHRRRRLRLPGVRDADARVRLAFERPVLRGHDLARVPDRGRRLVPDRRRRRVLRLPLDEGRARHRRRRWRSPRPRRSARPSRPARMAENPELVPRRRGRGRSPRSARRRGPAAPRRSAPTSSASAKRSGTSVEALRGRVTELTDWRRQVREHKRELVIGAAIVGFAVGGLMALRRR